MQQGERLSPRWNGAARFVQVVVRHRKPWLQIGRVCPDEFDQFQIADDLRLVIDIGQPAIQSNRVGVAQAHVDPRPQSPEKRIGVAPPAVHLNGQVKLLLRHRLEEALEAGGRGGLGLPVVTHALDARQGNHAIDWPWPVAQKSGVAVAQGL
jgi:hypothetical protein